MTLAAAPAEPELMVGHAPKLGKKHHHEQNEGYGSFFCTTWIKDGKSFRMINFAIMRGHLIIILTCVCFTVYKYAKFTLLKYYFVFIYHGFFFCFLVVFLSSFCFLGLFSWIGRKKIKHCVYGSAILFFWLPFTDTDQILQIYVCTN